MKKRLPLLLFPVLALILEALPYGAVLQFGRPAAAPLRELYSYFDLTPLRRSLRHLAPVSCWSCWRCTPGPESGDLPPQRGSQRASAPSSRSVRSCWASGIIPLPARSSRHPCWRNVSGCAAYGDQSGKTHKTPDCGRIKSTGSLCQCAEGSLFSAGQNTLQNPRFCGTMNAEINKRRDRSWQRSSALRAFTHREHCRSSPRC